MMWVKCGQPDCVKWKEKVKRKIEGSAGYKSHYQTYHKQFPTSQEEENRMKAAGKKTMYNVPNPTQSKLDGETLYQAQFRQKLLNFVVKNNLSFSLVEQAEFHELVKHLNPNVTPPTAITLKRDLSSTFNAKRERKKKELQDHVNAGGRISLTTDCWTAPNYKEFSAITGHWINTEWQHIDTLLDIIELTKIIGNQSFATIDSRLSGTSSPSPEACAPPATAPAPGAARRC